LASIKISKEKFLFEKGYRPNWSVEVFVVSKIIHRDPIRYQLSDLQGEPIDGSFYEKELMRVYISAKTLFKVDKILARKGKGANARLYVKWRGYPDKFNCWISAKEIQ